MSMPTDKIFQEACVSKVVFDFGGVPVLVSLFLHETAETSKTVKASIFDTAGFMGGLLKFFL